MNMRFFTLLILTMTVGVMSAQNVKNVRVYEQDTVIYVLYDLKKTSDITLQVSLDVDNEKYIDIKDISGDVGKNIEPGKGKMIMWDFRTDVGKLVNSSVTFKVKADRVVADKNKMKNNDDKRGKKKKRDKK